MGRLTELIDFLNKDEMPTAQYQQHFYTHLHVTEELKKLRLEYRKQLKQNSPEKQLSLFEK
jgi:hypothetical protein